VSEGVLGIFGDDLAQSPLGLRLTRVAPVIEQGVTDRRVGTVIAEAPLPRADEVVQPPEGFVIGTSVVPVPLRLGFEAAGEPDSITVRAPDGQPLAVIDMPVQEAEQIWATAIEQRLEASRAVA